ncbi:FIMAH domain-containing protein [Micromonospora sp. NPDC049497]|uniref:FIMAH domain-containing protein n=1 Tax=Micromonospora sp. NPDC049497 TaxID=3364273 RepID=UPI0037A33C7C
MLASSDPEPTVRTAAATPTVAAGRSRHRAADDGSRAMWMAVAAAAVVVVVAGLMVALSGDDGADGPGRAAFATPVDTGPPLVIEEPVPEEPSASSTASSTPTAAPSPPRRVRPADLVAQLRSTLDTLVRQDQVHRSAGRELRKRLQDVEQNIADGDVNGAREKLREFAAKLVELRREGKVGEDGYAALAAGATQLAQALPAR